MQLKDKVVAGALALTLPLVMAWEGLSLTPYIDIAGVLTNCYGNTHNVQRGSVMTEPQCKALLTTEVGRIANKIYNDNPDQPITVLAATTSLVYNIGDGAYNSSTLRRLLRSGDFVGACYQIPRWVYITKNGVKVKSKGLENRRKPETELCLTGLEG